MSVQEVVEGESQEARVCVIEEGEDHETVDESVVQGEVNTATGVENGSDDTVENMEEDKRYFRYFGYHITGWRLCKICFHYRI